MIKHQLLIALALIVGVAIGYFASGKGDAPTTTADESEYVAKGKVADLGSEASIKALRRRIAELEKQLAAKSPIADDDREEAISNAVEMALKERGQRRRDPREWLEELKKNDPAKYAQMTNRFAKWRQRRTEQARSTLEFLSSIDTSHMSAGAKKTHDELQELLARREELEEQLHSNDITEDQRHQIMQELHSTHRELDRLNSKERSNLITETAKSLGFSGNDAQEISATIQDVIDATGGNRGGSGHPPPPDGGMVAPAGVGGGGHIGR